MKNKELAKKIADHVANDCMWAFCQSWEGSVRCWDEEGLAEAIEKILVVDKQ